MAHFLVFAGADIDRVKALVTAAWLGRLEIVELLFTQDPDLTSVAARGETALICAILQGHTDVALLLIRAGCDVGAVCPDGSTILETARRLGQSDVVAALERG